MNDKPSLDGARARLARSAEHIASLEKLIYRLGDFGCFLVTDEHAFTEFTPPFEISILIGEIAYNLKTALDYIVYELYYLATGTFTKATKFIVSETENEWAGYYQRKGSKCWLPKLRAEHQAMLKALQPFAGIPWTKTLAEITNFDKHRRLTAAKAKITSTHIAKLSDERAAIMPSEFPPNMFMHFEIGAKISFVDGGDVIETLHFLCDNVAAVIEKFDPAFQ